MNPEKIWLWTESRNHYGLFLCHQYGSTSCSGLVLTDTSTRMDWDHRRSSLVVGDGLQEMGANVSARPG